MSIIKQTSKTYPDHVKLMQAAEWASGILERGSSFEHLSDFAHTLSACTDEERTITDGVNHIYLRLLTSRGWHPPVNKAALEDAVYCRHLNPTSPPRPREEINRDIYELAGDPKHFCALSLRHSWPAVRMLLKEVDLAGYSLKPLDKGFMDAQTIKLFDLLPAREYIGSEEFVESGSPTIILHPEYFKRLRKTNLLDFAQLNAGARQTAFTNGYRVYTDWDSPTQSAEAIIQFTATKLAATDALDQTDKNPSLS
jgi:hypothetical protein